MQMERRGRAIDKVYKRRDRIEMPDFQREEVWPDTKKRLLRAPASMTGGMVTLALMNWSESEIKAPPLCSHAPEYQDFR